LSPQRGVVDGGVVVVGSVVVGSVVAGGVVVVVGARLVGFDGTLGRVGGVFVVVVPGGSVVVVVGGSVVVVSGVCVPVPVVGVGEPVEGCDGG
jgi:hypothetical protein